MTASPDPPAPAEYIAALDATWPPEAVRRIGPFALREGAEGGGGRVTAATAEAPADEGVLDSAEAALRAAGRRPVFRLRSGACPWDGALDDLLAARGYARHDPTILLAAPVGHLRSEEPAGLRYFPLWPPLAIQRRIWADHGIGDARQAVMARVTGPKTALLARISDRPAGVAFVACHGRIAMLHAMQVAPALQRKGAARNLMQGAADWAAGEGAAWLALAVTEQNAAARGLYEGLGMTEVTAYHYRVAPEV